jgi:hypothetical protein
MRVVDLAERTNIAPFRPSPQAAPPSVGVESFQLPHAQVVEADFGIVAAEDTELDARLLDAEILARSPQRRLALDACHDVVALEFQQECVPLALREGFRRGGQRLALRVAVGFATVIPRLPFPVRKPPSVSSPNTQAMPLSGRQSLAWPLDG